MLKIIIIDDELATREGLIADVDWGKLGLVVSGNAEDGVFGLELAKKVIPDMILIDVSMPRMNGIACAKEIQKVLPDCKIIFMSGFTDKEFLKSAIQLNAVDYIEKPIDMDELHAVLAKTVKLSLAEKEKKQDELVLKSSLEQNALLLRQEMTIELIHKNNDLVSIKKRIESTGTEFSLNENFVTVILKFNFSKMSGIQVNLYMQKETILDIISEEFYNQGGFLAANLDSEHIVIHLYGNLTQNKATLKGKLKAIQQKINLLYHCEESITIGVGKQVRGAENIPITYQMARKSLNNAFLGGFSSIYFYEEKAGHSEILNEMMLQEIVEAIKNLDVKLTAELLDTFIQNIKLSGNMNVSVVKNAFLSMLVQISVVIKEHNVHVEDTEKVLDIFWVEKINQYTIDELRVFLVEKLLYIQEWIEEKEGKSKKVRSVMDYIKLSYMNNITITLIADHVELAPTYLCQLFKKETGKTINEYIEETRILKAKELLKSQSMKLSEVAERVGYSNANYFTTVFKKVTAQHPSEFRKKDAI